jgi:6-phosphogluconate dehydrogenase
MQIGMVGLGRMGSNIARRLLREDHECVVYNRSPAPVKELEGEGALGADSLEDLVDKLAAPRSVWVMIPAAATGQMVERLADLVEPGRSTDGTRHPRPRCRYQRWGLGSRAGVLPDGRG